MAQLIAVAARTIVPSRMLRLLPRTPVCPTHVLGQPVVCMVLCVCHLRIIFLSPTVTLSLHCRHTTSVTLMIRVVVSDEAEPVHFAALHKASPPVNWLTRLFFFFFFYVADHAKNQRAQCDCRRFATLFRLSRSRGRTKILAARSRIILSYTYTSLCVRIRPCIEPITVPPRQLIRVSRARSKLSPPEKRVAYANFHHGAAFLREERILFFFFFLPRANWPTSGDKVGQKTVSVDIEPRRHRRPVRSSHRARRVHLDERPRTNVPRISSAAVSKPFLKDSRRGFEDEGGGEGEWTEGWHEGG